MTEAAKQARPLRTGKAPRGHEWERWSAGLWRCPWCDGFCRSEKMPHPDAPAMSEARAAAMAQQVPERAE